jgi:hypothetical protein
MAMREDEAIDRPAEGTDRSSRSLPYGLVARHSWVGCVPSVTEADTRRFAERQGLRDYLSWRN